MRSRGCSWAKLFEKGLCVFVELKEKKPQTVLVRVINDPRHWTKYLFEKVVKPPPYLIIDRQWQM